MDAIGPNKERRRELRREQTPAERILWERLRDRQLLGLKFRRQCPISRYIADFCCKDPRLVIELDGDVHEEKAQVDHDVNRDSYLRSLDYEVLRFPNERILLDTRSVLAEIAQTVLRLRPALAYRT